MTTTGFLELSIPRDNLYPTTTTTTTTATIHNNNHTLSLPSIYTTKIIVPGIDQWIETTTTGDRENKQTDLELNMIINFNQFRAHQNDNVCDHDFSTLQHVSYFRGQCNVPIQLPSSPLKQMLLLDLKINLV